MITNLSSGQSVDSKTNVQTNVLHKPPNLSRENDIDKKKTLKIKMLKYFCFSLFQERCLILYG